MTRQTIVRVKRGDKVTVSFEGVMEAKPVHGIARVKVDDLPGWVAVVPVETLVHPDVIPTTKAARDFERKRDELLNALIEGGMERGEAYRKLSNFVRRCEMRGIRYGMWRASEEQK